MNSNSVSYQKGQQNCTENMRFSVSTSTGKEKDEETGFYYFGARYMDHELMTSWLSVDPMSDKYPSISPYAYCAWNPIKLVDPEGREVYVIGDEADRIVEQLQTGQMEVKRAGNGLLSVNLHGKKREDLSPEEKQIYDAITSTDVTIYALATKSAEVDGKHYFAVENNGENKFKECLNGGSNLGTKLNDAKNKACSNCFIDIDLMTKKGFDQGVAHEISECYQAGMLAIINKQDIDLAIQNVINPLMMQAHNSAVPERVSSGGMYQFGVPYGSIGKVKPLEFIIK